MIIFATPDFGASGIIVLFLLIAWAIVLGLVGLGLFQGTRLARHASPRVKRFGILLILVSGSVPFFCCLGPSHVVRIAYGNYPLGRYPQEIKQGMSADEVVAILGNPHERLNQGDGEHWYYWLDSFGIRWFGVRFAQEGRVIHTHGN